MRKVQRNLEVRIKTLLKQFPAVVLLGARQVGKTDLAKSVGLNWRYVDLENPRDLNRIQIDPDLFFSENPRSVILDEAQEYPEIFKVLRGVIDNDRSQKGRFILTGSSSPDLLKGISESLAGRVATLEVGTLKANEYYERPLSTFYSSFSGSPADIIERLRSLQPSLTVQEMRTHWFQGGYPEPTLANDRNFYSQWMEEYQRTFIERDLRKFFPRIQVQRYRKLISILSELSGTILNKSELASLLEVSQPTVTQYLGIADGTFIWRILPSFSKSKSKSLVKMPKGHFRDSGLLHSLMKIENSEKLLNHPTFVRSFESFVIEEMIKGFTAAGITGCNFSYYRTRSRAEVDLILEGTFGLIPVEIKFSSRVESRDLIHLNSFISDYKSPVGLLVNQSTQIEKLNEKVIQIPIGTL